MELGARNEGKGTLQLQIDSKSSSSLSPLKGDCPVSIS